MTPETTTISNDITDYGITSRRAGTGPSLDQPENTVYPPFDTAPDVVRHVNPATALWQSIPMAAGQPSQIAPLTASIDDVLRRIETISETIEEYLKSDSDERLRKDIRNWKRNRDSDQPFLVAARHAALNVLLKATLYEWYTHRGVLPVLRGYQEDAFETAADLTDNHAFEVEELVLTDILRRAPYHAVAELSWWRHGLLTAADPADDFGYLFAELIPAENRHRRGQFRTPRRMSTLMRTLATRDGDRLLDAGMGAGALSVPRAESESESVHAYGIEETRTGFLMATTALALTEQPSDVYEADFFNISPATLGIDPDAVIRAEPRSRRVDIVPGEVDAVIGNPPYVANRNLERDATHYRRHLEAFGDADSTPYANGDKQLSGRSNLFVYFLTYATQFLTDGGRLVYLLPTKWMETKYGETLQTFLLDHYKLSAVIAFDDAVFDDAQVDAVLLVAERCTDAPARRNTTTRFLTINSEWDPATISDLATADQTTAGSTDAHDDQTPRHASDHRMVTVRQSELDERDPSDGPLTQYFRASTALRSLTDNETLVPLDALASVTYGQRTGNNEFFLLDDTDLDTWPLADRFYRAALNDVGGITGYRLTTGDSDTAMLDVHGYVEAVDDRDVLISPRKPRTQQVQEALVRDGYASLRAYIRQWADKRDEDLLQDNDIWFDLGPLDAPDLVHLYRIHTNVRVFENQADLIPTNCANGIDVRPDVDAVALLGYLNSTIHATLLEVWGQSEGGGSLEVTTRTLRQMPVADVRAFTDATRDAVVTAYRALVRGDDDAQRQLDRAVLAAIDAEIDAEALRDVQESIMQDRLPNT